MSPRSGRQNHGFEPTIHTRDAESSIATVARFRGLGVLGESFLGLTPQALCCRLLRRLTTNLNSLMNSRVSRVYTERENLELPRREKIKPVIPKANSAPARREFLRFAGLGALGLMLQALPFARVFGSKRAGELLVYVGTYTTGKSEGIYLYRFDLSSGQLKHVATTSRVVNPSFLTLAPSRRYLYAVNEVQEFAGRKSGAVSAFAVDQGTGALRLLNQQASLGADPCYVDVDAGGRFVLVANYTGGNVTVFPVHSDGSLGESTDMKQGRGSSVNRERQEGPHAHCIVLDPGNRFAYSCDLGTDKIMIFRFDARNGKLLPGETPSGFSSKRQIRLRA